MNIHTPLVAQGLTSKQVEQLRFEYGTNSLPEAKVPGIHIVFLRQFVSPLILLLLVSAGIIFAMGDFWDTVIILFVVVFNSIIGTIQEGKAQNALLALKKMVEGSATVVRDGHVSIVSDKELVPHDIIILQEGDKVPADARLLESSELRVNESSITGESVPVGKEVENEHKSQLFRGTTVVLGSGKAFVEATGKNTRIGKISTSIASIDTDVPLKKNIEHLARILIGIVMFVAFIVFALGVSRGEPLVEMFKTVVALSVSLVPEGLPVVLTLVLASGVWKMTKHNVLVKRLQAVEALGRAKIIAVDKTGTITENEMTLQKMYINGRTYDVGGLGYAPVGSFALDGEPVDPLNHQDLLLAGRVAWFGVNARTVFLEETKEWKVSGDPTEAALRVFAEKLGFKDETHEGQKIFEIPFGHDTKYHLSITRFDKKHFLSMVGAPEVVLKNCDRVWRKQKSEIFTDEDKEQAEQEFVKFSKDGYRVVGLAVQQDAGESVDPENFKNLVFVGFCAIRDPLRNYVQQAVARAHEANIRVVMITGDHKVTAYAIAKQAGIATSEDRIITGSELDTLDDIDLVNRFNDVDVFARVTPEHKLRIVELFKKRGEIIAMTGDGVNDAPSLAAADLGIAMGIKGTEVAKDASDIVLLDDNFGGIISAVEEGRNIYQTIKKVIVYLLSTNIGEAVAITLAIIIGLPLPLLPSQIIWLNFVTDGFLVLALAFAPKEFGLLDKKFTQTRQLISWKMVLRMTLLGFTIAFSALIVFSLYLEQGLVIANTVALATLAASQWFNSWNCRHDLYSTFSFKNKRNNYLIIATLIVVGLQMFAVYNPFMQKILYTSALSLNDWLFIVVCSSAVLFVEEIRKFTARKFA